MVLTLLLPAVLMLAPAHAEKRVPYPVEHYTFDGGWDGFSLEGGDWNSIIIPVPRSGTYEGDRWLKLHDQGGALKPKFAMRTFSSGLNTFSSFSVENTFTVGSNYAGSLYPLVLGSKHVTDPKSDANVAFVEVVSSTPVIGVTTYTAKFVYRPNLPHADPAFTRETSTPLPLGPSGSVEFRIAYDATARTLTFDWRLPGMEQWTQAMSVEIRTFDDPFVGYDNSLQNNLFHFEKIGFGTSPYAGTKETIGYVDDVRFQRTTCDMDLSGTNGAPHPCQNRISVDFERGEFPRAYVNRDGNWSDDWSEGAPPQWHFSDVCVPGTKGPTYLGFHTATCDAPSERQHVYLYFDLQKATAAEVRFDMWWEGQANPLFNDMAILVYSTTDANPQKSVKYWWDLDHLQPPAGKWTTVVLDLTEFAAPGGTIVMEFIPRMTMKWMIDDFRIAVVTSNLYPTPVITGPTLVHDEERVGQVEVTLDGSSSSDPEGGLTYRWTKGSVLLGREDVLVWNAPTGIHQITLEVEDEDGIRQSTSHTVKVNRLPIARTAESPIVAHDLDGDGFHVVKLEGWRSYDPDGRIVNYRWQLTDTGTVIAQGSGVTEPGYAFPVGETNVTLTVKDNDGATNATDVQVVVHPNLVPVAVITYDGSTTIDDIENDGEIVELDGCASYDPDGSIVDWAWTGGHSIQKVETCKARVTLKGATHHTIELTVTDNVGAKANDMLDLVLNRPPAAAFAIDCHARTCTFNGSLSTDRDGDALNHAWAFPANGTAAGEIVDVTFSSHSPREVCLTVDDGRLSSPQVCRIAYPSFMEDFDDLDLDRGTHDGWWRPLKAGDCPESGDIPGAPGFLGLKASNVNNCRPKVDSTATFEAIQLPAISSKLVLSHWWSMHQATASDILNQQTTTMTLTVREPGGMTLVQRSWSNIDQPTSGGWIVEEVDLGLLAGKTVNVSLVYEYGGNSMTTTGYGWRVDDVRIVPTGSSGEVVRIYESYQ